MTIGRYLAVEPIVFYVFLENMYQTIPQLKDEIKKRLLVYRQYVVLNNKEGKTDINRDTQDFFVELGNELFWFNLKNADYENKNQDSFDLESCDKKFVIQVTSTTTAAKIKSGLEIFRDKYRTQFSRFKMRFVWRRGEIRKDYSEHSQYFDVRADIIDIDTVSNEINKILDEGRLLKILNIIEKYQSLSRLSYEEIKNILKHIKKYLQDKNVYEELYRLPIDQERMKKLDYMKEKDRLNKVERAVYRDYVTFNNSMDWFLKSDDNARYLYNSIAKSINKLLQTWDNALVDVMKEIVDSMPFVERTSNYYQTIMIVLCYMYFSCDIGKNPDASSW